MAPNEGIYKPTGEMMWHNFLGGIAWALGTTVGFAIIIILITFVLKGLGGVPLIGSWIASIVEATNQVLNSHNSPQ